MLRLMRSRQPESSASYMNLSKAQIGISHVIRDTDFVILTTQ
jgi:hypothetical protein